MKIKVLLVDDEKLERVLIRKGYDWEANGFEIIGEASNGDEALELFDIQEPDIVLTDINMPYMDGLMLTEKIKERSQKCRVVIVTGFREFEYARQALKLGVKDFILKPVNIQDIAAIAENIKCELKQEEGYNQEYNQLRKTVSLNKDIVMESYLQRLVENRIEEEEAIHKLQMYNLNQLLNGCICVNIRPHLKQTNNEEATMEYSNKILELIRSNQYNEVVSFVHYLCDIIVYFNEDSIETVYFKANQIKEAINNKLCVEVGIGISLEHHGFIGISKAFRQTQKAISANVILGRNSIITYREFDLIKKRNKENTGINWKDFVFCVENCLNSKVEDYIDEITAGIEKAGITDIEYLKLMSMETLAKATSVLTKHGKSLGQQVGEEYLYEEVSKIGTIVEMNVILKNLLIPIFEFSDSLRNRKSNKLIDQTLDYIEIHLYEPTLTLKDIAKKVFTNESYLSRVFKKEMSESLIEYITRKRIEQSMLLLNTTNLKAYEIAEQIGINDPHYFSICFKKQVGVTIKEYKICNS